jgi:hypothetical protein
MWKRSSRFANLDWRMGRSILAPICRRMHSVRVATNNLPESDADMPPYGFRSSTRDHLWKSFARARGGAQCCCRYAQRAESMRQPGSGRFGSDNKQNATRPTSMHLPPHDFVTRVARVKIAPARRLGRRWTCSLGHL